MIQVEHVTHRYPGSATDALRDVSLRLPEGAVSGLLGPNGAGKSTLLAILTGALRHQSGSVRVAGLDPERAGALKTISALVPQDYAFYPTLSARENLHFFAGVYGMAAGRWRERLDFVTEVCGLSAVLDRRAETYSGGLKRRLNLAVGLLNEPRILYLDEPTVGIDAESRQVILNAINGLRRDGITLVYTSHYMEEVEAICDNVTVIDAGRVLASGPLADFLADFGETGLRLELKGPLKALERALSSWQVDWLSDGAVRLYNVDLTVLPAVQQAVAEAGGSILAMRFGPSRLEEVYLRLLHRRGPNARPERDTSALQTRN